MKATDSDIICPICKGKGRIVLIPRNSFVYLRQRAAKILVGKGFSYRQVMRILGYKSPDTIFHIIKYKKYKGGI